MGRPKGFRVPPARVAVLDFDDGDYAGAEVRVSLDISMQTYLGFQQYLAAQGKRLSATQKSKDAKASTDHADANVQWFRDFGDTVLQAWNLQDKDGHPLPANGAGMMLLPQSFAYVVMGKWLQALQEPEGPLGETSSDGSTLPEESIPMAAL